MIKRLGIYCTLSVLILSTVFAFQQTHLHANATKSAEVKKYIAGDEIIVRLPIDQWNKKDGLLCHASYGSTIIDGEMEASEVIFKLPKHLVNKVGLVDWQLGKMEGQIYIEAQDSVHNMETYLGPPSIIAGTEDYSMLVSIPTDKLDNPLPDGTKVRVNHQFQRNIESEFTYVKDRVAHKNLYSYPRANRMLVSSVSKGKDSKEMTLNIVPEIPRSFKIYVDRNHNFADGNQISKLYTSTIKDKYGNLVADGTYVKFIIKDKNDHTLQTFGSTVNGIAQANMLHPNSYDEWTIKAFIEGIAESGTIRIIYVNIMEDFKYFAHEGNRKITVGPLKSFMNQLVPDGLPVSLNLYQGDELIQSLYRESENGKVSFHLLEENAPKGKYSCVIKTAGLEKRIEDLEL